MESQPPRIRFYTKISLSQFISRITWECIAVTKIFWGSQTSSGHRKKLKIFTLFWTELAQFLKALWHKWWKILRLFLCCDVAMADQKWKHGCQNVSSSRGAGFSSVWLKFMGCPWLSWVWRVILAGQRCQLFYAYRNLRQCLRFLQNKSLLGIVDNIKKEKQPCTSEVILGLIKSKRFRDLKNVL